MTTADATVMSASYRARVRSGVGVLGALVVLTIVEYVVAIGLGQPLLWLTPIAIAKGWLIMQFFMHAGDLRRGGHA